ncbi:hypothetical protein Y032_0057g2832 [Ancylostoma ceylanicum]|uniref:Uncharacterized protein n=1 Tax=Ancylostoma ceylanicum TaxID=53326 RepID=A0A016U4J7_9BILA|nr:hypothetical protein Y032_0057g2832 [Ancylostoma ceylanicum]
MELDLAGDDRTIFIELAGRRRRTMGHCGRRAPDRTSERWTSGGRPSGSEGRAHVMERAVFIHFRAVGVAYQP